MHIAEDINWFLVTLNAIGGLVIFLFGVSNMSDGLKAIGSHHLKKLFEKTTNNVFAGILVGTVATTILDSSSATIIMVIAMVNAQILTSRQSFGIILGSNIGTTIGCQIIAYDVGEFATIPLFIGFIIFLATKSDKTKQIGKSILGIGLIFFGIHYISQSVEPLRNLNSFNNLMTKIENPYWGAMTGAITTFIIQSSSATFGIILSFAHQNLITLSGAVAVMLGAEIGTCSDTLLASIGRSREAIRVAVFHLLFNFSTVILGLIFLDPLINLVRFISGETTLARQIANANVLFNVLGVLFFVGLIPLVSKMLLKMIPDKTI